MTQELLELFLMAPIEINATEIYRELEREAQTNHKQQETQTYTITHAKADKASNGK